ncbi:MAG: hypothetical protein R2853_04500 [Thermomicrobiales bacterium]
MEQGITLAGGRALLLGLTGGCKRNWKMPVYRADDPLTCGPRHRPRRRGPPPLRAGDCCRVGAPKGVLSARARPVALGEGDDAIVCLRAQDDRVRRLTLPTRVVRARSCDKLRTTRVGMPPRTTCAGTWAQGATNPDGQEPPGFPLVYAATSAPARRCPGWPGRWPECAGWRR